MGLVTGVIATAVLAVLFTLAYVIVYLRTDDRDLWKVRPVEREESSVAHFTETPAPTYAGPWRG